MYLPLYFILFFKTVGSSGRKEEEIGIEQIIFDFYKKFISIQANTVSNRGESTTSRVYLEKLQLAMRIPWISWKNSMRKTSWISWKKTFMNTNIAGNMLAAKYNKTGGIESDSVRKVWSRGYVGRKGGDSWCQITKEPNIFHVLG